MRQPSEDLEKLVDGFEATKYTTYRDIKGVLTNGRGHTGPDVFVGQVVDAAQVAKWWAQDVQEAVKTIADFVPQAIIDAIPIVSYDALVSFIYNVGRQAFRDPKTGKETNFSRALCAGRFDEVDDRMRDWVYSGGKKVNGLINRRSAEASQWNRGFESDRGSIAVVAEGNVPVRMLTPIPEVTQAEESGVVPDAPEKHKIMSQSIVASVVTVLGGVTASAPDLIATGSQLRAMLPDIKLFAGIGAVLIGLGFALQLWTKLRARKASGA